MKFRTKSKFNIFNVIQIEMPQNWVNAGYTQCELKPEELRQFKDLGIDTLIYWYGKGYYEGNGFGLFRINKKWGITRFNHCSCFGPLGPKDIFSFNPDSLKSLCEIPFCGDINWFNDYRELYKKANEITYKNL